MFYLYIHSYSSLYLHPHPNTMKTSILSIIFLQCFILICSVGGDMFPGYPDECNPQNPTRTIDTYVNDVKKNDICHFMERHICSVKKLFIIRKKICKIVDVKKCFARRSVMLRLLFNNYRNWRLLLFPTSFLLPLLLFYTFTLLRTSYHFLMYLYPMEKR